jgi:hypothetical protein
MLSRSLLRAQAPRLIARRAAAVPTFAPRVRFYADANEAAATAGIKEKVEEVISSSATLKDFTTDPRVIETTKKLKDLLETKGARPILSRAVCPPQICLADLVDLKPGYSITNPPGKLAMLGLVADSNFRSIFTEMRSIAADHNISDADIIKFGQIGMQAKSTVEDAVGKAEEVKDEVVDTARNAEAALEDKVKSKL